MLSSRVSHRQIWKYLSNWLDSRRYMPILLYASLAFGWLWVSNVTLPLISDMASYDLWAQSVLDQGHLPQSAYRPPIYPYFVAMVYRLAGYHPQAVYYIQVVLNLGIITLIARLGREIFGERHGRLAALVYAIMITPYILSSGLLTEIIFTGLLLAGIHLTILAVKGGWLPAAIAGLCFGLASLTRSIALPAPILMGAVIIGATRDRRRVITVATMVLVMILTIAPWTVRNYRVLGAFVPIDTISGLNLYLGNNPRSDGGYTDLTGDPLAVPDPTESEAEWDSKLKAAAIGHILKHPLRFANHAWQRFLLFWSLPLDWVSTLHAPRYPWIWFPLSVESFLVITGLLGTLYSWWRFWRTMTLPQWLLAVPILYFSISLSVFYIQARYRFPVMPLVILFGVKGIKDVISHES